MPEQDLIDLKAYLDTLPPVSKVVKANDLSFPFNQRWLMGVWKLLFFQSGTFKPDPIRTESWNQGAYIVNGPGHCVECHTPRNLLGALKNGELLAGNPDGPDGESVPAINPSRSQSFSEWSAEDIVFSLQTGMLPDGDFLGGSMGRVVENSTSGLRGSDLKAISEYLQSPATLETGGFFSTVFETRAAVARDHSSKGKHPGMVSDFFKWIIWLLLVVGICWLSAMVYRSKSRKSQTRR
jgi:mono/diheme cytochrome c family protein